MHLLTRIRIFIETLLGKEHDMDIAHMYPVLIDGEPAPTNSLFVEDPAGIIVIDVLDGVVYAQPVAVGSVRIGAQVGTRSGSIEVVTEDAPLVITFGDAVDL